MNAGTFITVLVLFVIVVLDIRYLMKNGLSDCGGDCGKCGSSCKWANDIQKARRKIRMQKRFRKLFHLE